MGRAPIAWLDETGWRVAAPRPWRWVCLSREAPVYALFPGRGFARAASMLGADSHGVLHHDGWAPYCRFRQAQPQTCLAHRLRRCREMIPLASPVAARLPVAVKQVLEKGLALRGRFDERTIGLHGLKVARGRLEASLDRLRGKTYRVPANRRLAKHLDHEWPHLFTFLSAPGVEATNNRAERARRPAVIARKTWGGNRTSTGARAQQILVSVLATCRQQGKDTFSRVTTLLRSPDAPVLDIVPASLGP